MKNLRNISVTGVALATFAAFAQNAFAVSVGSICSPSSTFAKLCSLQIGDVVGSLITFLFLVAGMVALGYLVYGGFKWITSGGDKANVEAARGTIIAAVIGLIIVLLAYVILNLVWTFFFGTALTTIDLPVLP